MWIRGEIAPQEQFLPFSTIFSTYISNKRSQITCSFVKFRCSIGIFLSSAHLIFRITDISKCFRGSLQLRDNESRLYRSNPYMDNCIKMFLSIYKYVPSAMALTHIGAEIYHKVSEANHKVKEAKILIECSHGW